jgi:hypothetical protein
MKTILLSLSIFILNIHLSTAQTKKIALRSHSGSNASFTIYVPDEFGLGPSDYQLQKLNRNKKCSLNIKPIKPSQIQVKDSMDSIKFCTPLPLVDSSAKHHSTAPKPKPRTKKKKAKKTVKKVSLTTEIETESIALESQHTKTQVAGFVSTESSESFLILLLSIPALLFFIFTFKKP